MTKHNYSVIITTSIAVLVLIFLITQIKPKDICRVSANIQAIYFLPSFLFYILSYCLLAIRWKLLIQFSGMRFRKLFLISAVHNLFNNLLPAKTGELYYFYAVKKYGDISLEEGFATLFVARIFDLLSLFLLFLFAVATLGVDYLAGVSNIIYGVIFFFIVPLVFALSFLFFGSTIIFFIESCFSKVPFIKRLLIVSKLISKGKTVVGHLQSIHHKSTYAKLLIISLSTMLIRFVLFYFAIKGFGYRLDFVPSIISSTIAFLAMILPIQTFAGLGTTQAGWAVGLSAVGIARQDAILLGFALHLCILIFMTLVGGVAYLCLVRKDMNLAWKNLMSQQNKDRG